MTIISFYSKRGYTVIEVDFHGVLIQELYRAPSTNERKEMAPIESIRIWAEQTGRDIAKATDNPFAGAYPGKTPYDNETENSETEGD